MRHFGKTYTFVEEFVVLCPEGIEIQQEQPGYSAEARCILDVNTRKLGYLWKKVPLPSNIAQLNQVFEEYCGLYERILKDIDNNRTLEKGERYISDEYLIVLSDLFREWFEGRPLQPIDEPTINLLLVL